MFNTVEPKTVVPGVVAWEGSIDVPDGIVDQMNNEVDEWKKSLKDFNLIDNTYSVIDKNGPIRFNPEHNFKEESSINYFKNVVSNTLDKLSLYFKIYPDVEQEVHWCEPWQYITYRPPKNMHYHSDNHSTRQEGNHFYMTPFLRRVTILTYLTDDHKGGALDFRYWEHEPYKPQAGTVVVMPSNFMYSHATTPLLNGRKSAFLCAFSSGSDIDYNDNRRQLL